jgi:hypothetical protein
MSSTPSFACGQQLGLVRPRATGTIGASSPGRDRVGAAVFVPGLGK